MTSRFGLPVSTGQPFSALDHFERVTSVVPGEQHAVEFVVGVRGKSSTAARHVPFCSVVPVANPKWLNRAGKRPRLFGEHGAVASHEKNPVCIGDNRLPIPVGWDGAALLHYVGSVGIDPITGGIVLSDPIALEMLRLGGVAFDDRIFEYDGSVWGAATLYCQQLGSKYPGLKAQLDSRGYFPRRKTALFELFQRRGRVLKRAPSVVSLPGERLTAQEFGVPRRLCAMAQ